MMKKLSEKPTFLKVFSFIRLFRYENRNSSEAVPTRMHRIVIRNGINLYRSITYLYVNNGHLILYDLLFICFSFII